MNEKNFSELTQEERDNKIAELEKRIENLSQHRSMWSHAGGLGGRMASETNNEIQNLWLLIDDLKNGTHKYKRSELNNQINKLHYDLEDAFIIGRIKIKRVIKLKEKELKELNKIDTILEANLIEKTKNKKK
ncbi:MAG: hypothetical protein IJ842_01590 [Bacilli bacterium]|nr:hypothetical protein [Bacilli bacterium]